MLAGHAYDDGDDDIDGVHDVDDGDGVVSEDIDVDERKIPLNTCGRKG